MIDKNPMTLIDEVEATDVGAQGLAAANLAGQVMRLLHEALDESDLDQKALAEKVGVSQGRVSQVLNGDGNLRTAAIARYLRAMGYEAQIAATPVQEGLPKLPRHRSRRSPRNAPVNADVVAPGTTVRGRLLELPSSDLVAQSHEREGKKSHRWVEVKPVLSNRVVDLASYGRWKRSKTRNTTYRAVMSGSVHLKTGHG
ncbi:MAG: helix-turn-helix domain-containing protein [Sciscionella sp.]